MIEIDFIIALHNLTLRCFNVYRATWFVVCLG